MFFEWYSQYPRKVARLAAERAWNKLTPEERLLAIEALPTHCAYWEMRGVTREFIPHPATWLNGKRFDDELDLDCAQEPWWKSEPATMDMGRKLDVKCNPGEDIQSYRRRISDAIAARAGSRAVPKQPSLRLISPAAPQVDPNPEVARGAILALRDRLKRRA